MHDSPLFEAGETQSTEQLSLHTAVHTLDNAFTF